MNRDLAAGSALCVFGMAVLGGSVSFSRAILDYPTLTGQALRYAVAALLLAALLKASPRLATAPITGADRREPIAPVSGGPSQRAAPAAPARRPTRREFLLLCGVAALGLVAFNVFLLAALRHADAAAVGTAIGAAPLGLALIGPLMRGQRPAARLVTAALIVVAGTALVHGAGEAETIGVLAALGALLCEVAFSLLAAAALPRLGAVRVSAYSCGLAVPMLLLAAIPAGELAALRAPTGAEALTFGYLAVMMTVVAFLAWFTGLKLLGVERAGMFVGVLPVATLVTAAVQDGRLPDPIQTAGVLVVVLGLFVGLTARSAEAVAQRADRGAKVRAVAS